MDIYDFISKYKNHPILFIGSGFSMRYAKKAYNWDGLLEKVATEISSNTEYFLDLKADYMNKNDVMYEKGCIKTRK